MDKNDMRVLEIKLDEDLLKATLRINNFSVPPKELLEEVKKQLSELGIKSGVQPKLVKEALLSKKVGEQFVIAGAIEPSGFTAPNHQFLIEFKVEAIHHEPQEGSVDHKEVIRPNVVTEDQPLVRIIPGEPGKAGKNLKGEPIEPPDTMELLELKLGENVKISEKDPNLVLSAVAGIAEMDGNILNVKTTLVIEGDVDYDCGNINFPGSVWVKGDVKSGFTVKAEQNIKVNGSVENAHVEAGQDLQVKHGFTGAMRGFIYAKRNAFLGFAHNQKIEVGDTLSFEVELLGCNTKAAKKINSKGGRIVGGETLATEGIEVRTIGSEEEIYTKIGVGQKSTLNEKKAEIEASIKEKLSGIENNKKAIYDLVSKKIAGNLSESEGEKLEHMQDLNDEIQTEIIQHEQEIEAVEVQITNLKEAFVRVSGIMYPQVEIQIGHDFIINKEKQRFVMYREKNGEITRFTA